jgi:hypothetical protein
MSDFKLFLYIEQTIIPLILITFCKHSFRFGTDSHTPALSGQGRTTEGWNITQFQMQKPNPDNVISFYIHNNPLTDIDFTSPSRLYTTPYTCYCAGAAKIAYLKKKKRFGLLWINKIIPTSPTASNELKEFQLRTNCSLTSAWPQLGRRFCQKLTHFWRTLHNVDVHFSLTVQWTKHSKKCTYVGIMK